MLKSLQHAIKTASKTAIQKRAEATGDLIGNETVDTIKSVSKKSKELHSNEVNNEIPKER